MPHFLYDNFDVLIERDAAGYVARVDSEAGQLKSPVPMVIPDWKATRFSTKTQIQAAGDQLFRMLFVGGVLTQLRRSIDSAEHQGKGLRVRLKLTDVPELAQLPWEFMYDTERARFLVLSTRTPLVRYHELAQGVGTFAVKPPLTLLAVMSGPRDWKPKFDVEEAWDKLEEATAPLQAKGLVKLERLKSPTLRALRSRIRQGDIHILHYHGHGAYDEKNQQGLLILEDDDNSGKGRRVEVNQLATLLHDANGLRLVVLNACEGALGSPENPFRGTAQTLVQQDVPAVIAMQSQLTNEAGLQLAREFYMALADDYPVDMALIEGRKALVGDDNQVEWGFPVLYMRVADAQLFDGAGIPPQANGSAATPALSASVTASAVPVQTGLLTATERDALVGLLEKLPNLEERGTMRALVAGLPQACITNIPTSATPHLMLWDIINIVDGVTWAQLPDDSWSILRVIENAIFLVRGARLEKELQQLLGDLQERALERTPPKYKRAGVVSTARLVTGQMQALYDAFVHAFPSKTQLARLVAFRMDERLEAITQEDAAADATFGLIQWADENQRVADLIAAARQEKPGDSRLRALAEELGLVPVAPPMAAVAKATTRSAAFFDVEMWRTKLSQAEPTVCRVETNAVGQQFFGTGFLVGPNLVMTAFHVVEPVVTRLRAGEAEVGEIQFRFGFKQLADKTIAKGQVYKLAAAWLVDSSPPDELNYALLALEGTPGDDPIDGVLGAPPRHWLKPAPNTTLHVGDTLFMIQHPEGGPLKITIQQDAVFAESTDGKHITYKMDTVGGSSGSPCFTRDWELVAMHERRQQEMDHGQPLKGGILLAAIMAQPKVQSALEG